MTLREELEILRGEPILVHTVKPEDVPCIETSDAERLCKNPVVSVHMITYNHEPYIRQAIEGVMMQQTDFEFELVIGEDCSQDKTREICFEYQKKYPDKIRVLWWHENVSKLGGNGRRVTAHCRGEFIAFCEGDDYWTDPLKLQKQVEIMRKNPNVSLCYCGSKILKQDSGSVKSWDGFNSITPGVTKGRHFLARNVFGGTPYDEFSLECFLPTATCMFRRDGFSQAQQDSELMTYRLLLGDVPLWLSLAQFGDVFYLQDEVSVYRRTSTGAVYRLGSRLWMDNILTRLYFHRKYFAFGYDEVTEILKRNLYILLRGRSMTMSEDDRSDLVTMLANSPLCAMFAERRYRGMYGVIKNPASRWKKLKNVVLLSLCLPKPLSHRVEDSLRQCGVLEVNLRPCKKESLRTLFKSIIRALRVTRE